MSDPHVPANLVFPLIFLTAAVVAVPLFKRLGLGAVLGYLAAGVIIGPSVLGLLGDAESLMHTAEFGVVLFLFVIGLELNLERLWAMRRDILGLGTTQIAVTGIACMLYPYFVVGVPAAASVVAGLGLALSSTAFVMQTLEERREANAPHGRKAFSILLMQDISIVPLLAIVALLASGTSSGGEGEGAPLWQSALAMVAAIAAVILAGRYALNPMFRLLSRHGGREIMTIAALLVVVVAAVLMALVGVSMALGAFLAGVMLAESSYRHELEADIEPFRGLLLGLFFVSVGASVDLALVAENWLAILAGLAVYVTLKFGVIYGVVRVFGSTHRLAVRTAAYLAQGGEFGFVLFSAAVSAGVMAQQQASLLIALVTLSMALTPLLLKLAPRLLIRDGDDGDEREEDFEGARGSVLLIGFGRVGQVASQMLLARACEVTLLDNDAGRIDDAGAFGFKVYYGDGTRLDVLRAAGADESELFLVCIDDQEASRKCVEILQQTWPDTPLHVRAYDRRQSIWLRERGVSEEVRETFESAILMGRNALEALGLPGEEAREVEAQVRRADLERLEMQAREGMYSGTDIFVRPEPLDAVSPRKVRDRDEDDGERPRDTGGVDEGAERGGTRPA